MARKDNQIISSDLLHITSYTVSARYPPGHLMNLLLAAACEVPSQGFLLKSMLPVSNFMFERSIILSTFL